MKITDRKAFNFFRSYYDVFKELPTKSAKSDFIEAILDKQFLFKEPKSLKGLSKFAYISQKHSIDAQVDGFLNKVLKSKPTTPIVGGSVGGSVQEKEKEKEKEKGEEENSYIDFEEIKNYISISERKVYDLFDYFKKEKGIWARDFPIKQKIDFTELCDLFMEEKSQQVFNDENHLQNAFIRHVGRYKQNLGKENVGNVEPENKFEKWMK